MNVSLYLIEELPEEWVEYSLMICAQVTGKEIFLSQRMLRSLSEAYIPIVKKLFERLTLEHKKIQEQKEVFMLNLTWFTTEVRNLAYKQGTI